ncbi:hypothetical protein TDB9533_00613 [Thalassocella blandensis]|nr:hypothetical protein TDB9533_00613 [Thalassocella blandensis]
MIKHSVLLVLISLLISCSSAPKTNIESYKGKLPDDKGIVIAEVYSNSHYIPGSTSGWNELVFIDIDAEEQQLYTIKQIQQSKSRSTFAGLLPVGRYGLAVLSYVDHSDASATNVKVSLPQSLGIFEVRPQGITDLGTILYHAMKTQHFLDSTLSSYAVSREENPHLLKQIKQTYPKIFANVQPEQATLHWNRDNFNSARTSAKDMILAAELPVNLIKSNKHYYLPTKYGNLITARNNNWDLINTGLTRQIDQLVEVDNSKVLVADELQQLYLIETQNSAEQPTPKKIETETVIALKRVADLPIVVTHIPEQQLKIYSFQNNTLSLMTSFEYAGFLAKVEEDTPTVYFGKDTVSINVEGNMVHFNVAKSTWAQSLSPNYHKVYRLDNNYLVAAEASQWTQVKNITLSTDNGTNWNNTPIDGNYEVYFDKGKNLYYIEQGFKTSFDAPPEILKRVPFYTSKDKGLTVEAISKLPEMCDKFMPAVSEINNFLVLCTNGDIYRSQDQGKNWGIFYQRNTVDMKKFPKILFTSMTP